MWLLFAVLSSVFAALTSILANTKIFGLIDILEQYVNQLREPYSKSLDDGIFELRAKVGSDI